MSGVFSAVQSGAKGGLALAAFLLAAAHGAQVFPRSSAASQSAAETEAKASEAVLESAPAADPVVRWKPYIAEASARFGVPVTWIERVIRAESGGLRTLGGRPITSRAGAMGLMQLMPQTWAAMRARYALGIDPYDPHDNILAGTAYLAAMYSRFGYPGLFGAYNAGPARYAQWLAGQASLPSETGAYLAQVAGGVDPRAAASTRPSSRLPGDILPVQPVSRPPPFAIDRAHSPAEASGTPAAKPTARDPLFAVLAQADRPSSPPPED